MAITGRPRRQRVSPVASAPRTRPRSAPGSRPASAAVARSDRFGDWESDALPTAREQLAAYFAGELTEFDLPVVLHGTAFQPRVWAALREIPYGVTSTYGELAEAIGSPTASRAVGLANGRNPGEHRRAVPPGGRR